MSPYILASLVNTVKYVSTLKTAVVRFANKELMESLWLNNVREES